LTDSDRPARLSPRLVCIHFDTNRLTGFGRAAGGRRERQRRRYDRLECSCGESRLYCPYPYDSGDTPGLGSQAGSHHLLRVDKSINED
jgi:hypothetical protein